MTKRSGWLNAILGIGIIVFASSMNSVEAASAKKKNGLKNRSEYTAEQRAKIFETARKICRKKYGAPANVQRIDYGANKVWCTTN
jgi:hypothetical protein